MIIAMAHLLIFDALNLIRRLHAAIGKQPLPAESLLKATCQRVQQTVRGILDEVTPSHVIAVFDGESPSWRHELYPEYKAGRSPMPPELATGMEALQESLWHCGVDALLSEGDEADDLIATLNQQLFLHQQQVTLISTDKGFCQLLDTGIQIRDYFNRRCWITPLSSRSMVCPPHLWSTTGPSPASPVAMCVASRELAPREPNNY